MSNHPLKKKIEKKSELLSLLIKPNEDYPSPLTINEIQELKESTIATSQTFKLSIKEFTEMCKDKNKIRELERILNKDYDQINKFCKYLHIIEDNYEKSPDSIHTKMKETKLYKLPLDIKSLIISKFSTLFPKQYKLKNWIPKQELNFNILCSNVNAVDLITEEYNKNPDSKNLDWFMICLNPSLIDIIEKENMRKPENINWSALSINKNAIELIDQKIQQNESPNLQTKYKINWGNLALNPNGVYLIQDKINYEKNYRRKSYWNELCQNENAIEIIDNEYKRKTNRLNWKYLSKNSNAIHLIEKKIKEEENIPIEILNKMNIKQKISWRWLSTNKNAINILKNNIKKIDWEFICENSNKKIIDLIEIGIKENKPISIKKILMNPILTDYFCNKYPEQIDYYWLCFNPSKKAIKLIENHYKYGNSEDLDWYILSRNPSIFTEI